MTHQFISLCSHSEANKPNISGTGCLFDRHSANLPFPEIQPTVAGDGTSPLNLSPSCVLHAWAQSAGTVLLKQRGQAHLPKDAQCFRFQLPRRALTDITCNTPASMVTIQPQPVSDII